MQWLKAQSYATKLTFEDVQEVLKRARGCTILSTLPPGEQRFLLPGTVVPGAEEARMNHLLAGSGKTTEQIVVYGKNACDDLPYRRYKQLAGLGFKHVGIYAGGLLEWALLQDVYGNDLFPSKGECEDILAFRGAKRW